MNEVKYRKAKLEDLPVLYEFEQQIIATERPFDPTLKPGRINYYDLREKILEDASELIVGVSGDEVVCSGYASIRIPEEYLDFERFAYMGFMYVRPAFRGKGAIRGLIVELEQWALSQNITEVRLEVYDDNAGALRAYDKAGFKRHMVVMRRRIGE